MLVTIAPDKSLISTSISVISQVVKSTLFNDVLLKYEAVKSVLLKLTLSNLTC